MYCVLENYSSGRSRPQWGLAYKEPHFGPYSTIAEAQDELDRYAKRWPEDEQNFGIFELSEVRPRGSRR